MTAFKRTSSSSDNNCIHILTDHDRWCDRKNTKTKPPFVLWQKLNVEGSKPILTVSWCEELSNIGTEYWLAAATCTSVYLFAASTADENQISVLPVWELIRKIDVQKKGRINTLSWSSFFGVRKLLVGGHACKPLTSGLEQNGSGDNTIEVVIS